jgi:hypothetical protein
LKRRQLLLFPPEPGFGAEPQVNRLVKAALLKLLSPTEARRSNFGSRESLAKSDRKLGGRQFPGYRRILPLFGDVAQRQKDQLSGRLIAGEMASIFEHFTQLYVQTLNRIGVGRITNKRL